MLLGRWKQRIIDLDRRLAQMEGYILAFDARQRAPDSEEHTEEEEPDDGREFTPRADNSIQVNR